MPDTDAANIDIANIKAPPFSLEAEQSVIGGLMLENKAWDDVMDRVLEGDFYRREHQLIFAVLKQLAEESKPLDVITVTEALENRGELKEVGGLAYLAELANNTPSAANVIAYCHIVRERAVLRNLIRVANGIADNAYFPKGRSSSELLDGAERMVFEIAEQGTKGSGPRAIKPILTNVLDTIDKLFSSDDPLTGVSTGYDDLDGKTGGLQASDLIIVAGRPSMGKTSFAMNLAENALMKDDVPVLVFSMEMPAESLVMRMLSSLGRIDQSAVRSGKLSEDDWPRLTSALTLLQEKKLLIDDTAALSPTEVRARARRAAREFEGGLGLIVLDYLQLMQVPGLSSRVEEISEISRSLKALAKELHVPVVALSQLNRGLEQRPNKRPVMSDLRESGAIEQDADVIMFIYRDEVYHPDSPDQGVAEIIIGKQRNGPIGTSRLAFQGQFTRFEDLAPGYYTEEYE